MYKGGDRGTLIIILMCKTLAKS